MASYLLTRPTFSRPPELPPSWTYWRSQTTPCSGISASSRTGHFLCLKFSLPASVTQGLLRLLALLPCHYILRKLLLGWMSWLYASSAPPPPFITPPAQWLTIYGLSLPHWTVSSCGQTDRHSVHLVHSWISTAGAVSVLEGVLLSPAYSTSSF